MGHIYKWLGSDEQAKKLWGNKEAVENYIAALKEFWDEENKCWIDSPLIKQKDGINTQSSQGARI